MKDDAKIVKQMVDNMLRSLERDTPLNVMKQVGRAPLLMYNAVLHLLYKLCIVCNISSDTLKGHVDRLWNDANTDKKKGFLN